MVDDLRARIAEALERNRVLTPEFQARIVMEWVQPQFDLLRADVDKSTGLVDALRRQCEATVAENRELRARLREHDACRTCGHERRQHGRDPVIRRDWCSGCKTSCDLPAFQPVEENLS